MTPVEERLHDLLRRAVGGPTGVSFDAVARGVRRRRARMVVSAAIAVVAVLGAVAGTASLASSNAQHDPVLVGPGPSISCPTFDKFRIAPQQMQHTAAEASRVVTTAFTTGQVLGTIPVLFADPIAPKVGLGPATTARKMWVVIRREVAGARPPGSAGPPAPTPGTVSIVASLVDDATLQLGGNLGCDWVPPPTKCCVAPPSPHLKIQIAPTAGPPRTIVTIQVAGCEDRSGNNHAVSFNNDALNPSARFDPGTVRPIKAVQHGTRLTATYTVVKGDATGGTGTFFVQCGQTLRQADFHVTA